MKILEKSDARDYMPLFARHRISIETLLQMSEDDLKQVRKYFKVNGSTLGGAGLLFSVCPSLLPGGQLLKEKNLLLQERGSQVIRAAWLWCRKSHEVLSLRLGFAIQ